MTAGSLAPGPALLVRVGARPCAVPLADVVETMRPLPVEPIAGVPPFVRGVAVMRGCPVPVVDLASLLGARDAAPITRFVSLRVGERRVALAVDAVLGVLEIDRPALHAMPPLLRDASADAVQGIATLDAELLVVLRATRILPERVWQALAARQAVGWP